MKKKRIDINADVGESFGIYKLGNDDELMKYLTTANIACGFHAGDPCVMRKTVELAKANNVAIGAHPGFPDLMGFGRRRLDITPKECKDYVTYQVGALKAFVEAYGLKLQHVKPHGKFWHVAAAEEQIGRALIESVLEIDPKMAFVGRRGAATDIAREKGLRVIIEIGADMQYRPNLEGVLSSDYKKKETDPSESAERIVKILDEGRVQAIDGTYVDIDVDTVLVHGDTPNAIEVVAAVREALLNARYEIGAFGRQE
ncbi:MAG: 5-oxoprolinase subunit PxpA [Pseudomonadota bacterium]